MTLCNTIDNVLSSEYFIIKFTAVKAATGIAKDCTDTHNPVIGTHSVTMHTIYTIILIT